MKRGLGIVTLLWLGYFASAQQFVNTENVWFVKKFTTFGGWHLGTDAYRFGEEVLINELIYRRLEISTDSLISWTTTNSFYREDETGKVFLSSDASQEILIYDFSGTIDSFLLNDYCSFSLEQTESIQLLNGESRKYLTYAFFHPWGVDLGHSYAIEGIGFVTGNPFTPSQTCLLDVLTNFSCYFRNEELLYNAAPDYPCFSHPTSLSNPALPDLVQFSPNPAAANGTIRVQIDSPERLVLQIWSATGAFVVEEAVQKEAQISQSNPGMYFYTLTDRDKRWRQVGKLAVH